MAEHQLVSFLIADIADIELAVFSADDAIEHHVLQHIAQLLLDILVIALHQGITKLESLLDGIRTKTLECLLLIPWTLQAQTILYIQQAAERRHFLFFRMHNSNLTLKFFFPFLPRFRIKEDGKRNSSHTHHYIEEKPSSHNIPIHIY